MNPLDLLRTSHWSHLHRQATSLPLTPDRILLGGAALGATLGALA